MGDDHILAHLLWMLWDDMMKDCGPACDFSGRWGGGKVGKSNGKGVKTAELEGGQNSGNGEIMVSRIGKSMVVPQVVRVSRPNAHSSDFLYTAIY